MRDKTYIPAPEVCERLGVSDMWLYRTLHRKGSDFPRPFYFGKRRFFDLAELESWEAKQRQPSAGAAS